MNSIWKYTLSPVEYQSISMPQGCTILHLAMQNSIPCLWVSVDPTQSYALRMFITVGTGNPIPHPYADYIGTYQSDEYVFHVFEID